MQSLNRNQEKECIALVESKKVNVLELNKECNNKANGGLQVFLPNRQKSWACCVNYDLKSLNKGTYL